ncbi:MAG: CoA-binding protein [Promethearchaeota archaeon]
MTTPERHTISEMLDIKSVAIVGVSSSMGHYWPHSMLQWPHNLKLWFVSRREGEALGHKLYQSVSDIPEDIDFAIVRVPYQGVSEVLKEASVKGAKGVTIFTSGFSELGTEEGKQREEERRKIAETIPTRVLGPNCMGLMYPKIGMAFMPTVKQLAGDVGFLSQSGGVAISTYTAGVEAGVGFSKMFSFGNAVDITPAEILDYFIDDRETAVVGAYIEGTKEGSVLLQNLKHLAEKKPVVVLKGGKSEEGSRVASSHTGALAGSNEIWDAAFRQANVATVATLEDLIATLGLFSLSPPPASHNVGVLAISGGTSVVYTDLCIEAGLEIPPTSDETMARLDPLIKDVGTSIANPIDLAADYYDFENIGEVIRIAGEESRFDSIILEVNAHHIHQVGTIMGLTEMIGEFWTVMAIACKDVVKKQRKPVLVTIPEVAYPEVRAKAWNIFVEEGLPVFRNITETVGPLSKVRDYYETRENRAKL